MGQLNANSVVHDNEDEKKSVCHKVVLVAALVEPFVVLTSSFIDLDGSYVDGVIANESTGKPKSDEEVEPCNLNEKLEQIDVFHLCLLWLLS